MTKQRYPFFRKSVALISGIWFVGDRHLYDVGCQQRKQVFSPYRGFCRLTYYIHQLEDTQSMISRSII